MSGGGGPLIGVRPAGALIHHARVFDALSRACGARFAAADDREPCDGLLLLGPEAEDGSLEKASTARATLALMGAAGRTGRPCEVRIGSGAGVDRRLRGVVLAGEDERPPLGSRDGEPLAVGPNGPVWTRRGGGHPIDRAVACLPPLGVGQTLFEAIGGPHSLAIIALIGFIRSLGSAHAAWPRVRAAFVFDDPNLRLSHYGHISYPALAAHADAHAYHVAMAMIPLDSRSSSRAAVALFRARPDLLSLVIHGNNHLRRELMTPRDFPAALSLCAQSLRRIAGFESRTGLHVDRVMMPPHGAWSRLTARALGALGYDALCTTQSRPPTETGSEACALAGLAPARFIDGCAVVPRLPLGADSRTIAVRAFLGHPLVFYGHHADLADGLEPLAAAAALVNELGEVDWCSVGEIVHSNFEISIDGDTAIVRPWAGRIRVELPDCVASWTVARPPETGTPVGLTGWRVRGGRQREFGELVGARQGAATIELLSACQTDAQTVAPPARSMRALVRRRLTEARDRLAPVRRVLPVV
jgi:hypothetical protein